MLQNDDEIRDFPAVSIPNSRWLVACTNPTFHAAQELDVVELTL